jgi:putrescine transport system ATP-binding protein
MNLFAGRVTKIGPEISVDAGSIGTLRAPAGEARISVGDAVHVAVRPEKLSLLTGKARTGTNVVTGKLVASTYLGDRSRYLVQVPGVPAPVSVSLQHDGQHAAGVALPGSEINLAWPASAGIVLTA